MQDGDYAVDHVKRWERIASLVVVAGWTLIAFFSHGLPLALRLSIGSFLPLACIWFPDAMQHFKGPTPGRDFYVREPSHPGMLRILAWIAITVGPALLLLVLFLRR